MRACSAATVQAHQSTVESLGMLGEITAVADAGQALGSTGRLAESRR
ncbi:hypothetical protein RF644_02970 [Kocuria sp. CPCC 205258]